MKNEMLLFLATVVARAFALFLLVACTGIVWMTVLEFGHILEVVAAFVTIPGAWLTYRFFARAWAPVAAKLRAQ